MSIYIPGINLPPNGEVIVVRSDGQASQYIRGDVAFIDFPMRNGKALELPPHGRLIEDVAVREQIDEWLDSVGDVVVGRGLSYYGELLGCIEDAPTIIPAEGGTDG